VEQVTLLPLILVALGSLGSQNGVTVAPQDLISSLHSTKWEVRRDAFERLLAPPDALKDKKTIDLLLILREKENIESEKSEPDLFEDDDYLAYDERLVKTVEGIAENYHGQRIWSALLNMRYNSDSAFGEWVAGHPIALQEAEKLIRSRYGPRRSNGIFLSAAILAKNRGAFPQENYRRVRTMIRFHLLHDIPPVRYDAILGLGLIGVNDDARLLDAYAAKCPDRVLRESAIKQAQIIRSRLDSERTQRPKPTKNPAPAN
jgi:hypothetical protein